MLQPIFKLNRIYLEVFMTEDTRCCGTGTCLINAEGFCWCGQRWDGDEMQRPACDEPESSQTGSVDFSHNPVD